MGTTAEKLQAALNSKAAIKTAIEGKGQVVGSIPFSEYAPLIDAIETGGGSTGTSRFYLNKCILTVDDGYQIERIPIHAGDVIDLGEGADVETSTNWGSYYHAKSHPAMTFQEWASSVTITNNEFVVPNDICTDYHVGAIYVTTDGLNHYIEFDSPTGFSHRSDDSSSVVEGDQSEENPNRNLTACWLGSNVTSITEDAFAICSSLTSVNIPAGVTDIGGFAFGFSLLTSITIPNGLTNIGMYAFAYCYSLISINIPNSVTTIGESAFSFSSLTSITIPNGVADIGSYTFAYCHTLTSITISNGVTSVNESAFKECFALTLMILNNSIPPTLNDEDELADINCTFLVPVGSIPAYEVAMGWTDYVGRFIENTEENRKLFGIW